MKQTKWIHSPWILLAVFLFAVAVMTAYEGLKELVFEGTLTPWQSHAITILITSAIATLSAFFIRSRVLSVFLREREIEAKEQSLLSFGLILSAVSHIVNNVLNYLQLVEVEIEEEGRVKEETRQLLHDSIREADRQMKLLNKIQAPSDPESYKGIFPG